MRVRVDNLVTSCYSGLHIMPGVMTMRTEAKYIDKAYGFTACTKELPLSGVHIGVHSVAFISKFLCGFRKVVNSVSGNINKWLAKNASCNKGFKQTVLMLWIDSKSRGRGFDPSPACHFFNNLEKLPGVQNNQVSI